MKIFVLKHSIEITFVVVYISLSGFLNSQFLIGSNINTIIAGHDEYIGVKEIYSILHPVSLKHFLMAVISGNALYYGRIMFYLDAIIAYLPFKIWGITGMVYAIRMTHALLITLSLVFLSSAFLINKIQKILFLMGSASLYYSLYFIMMPKPEPWQLLFLALFIYKFRKKDWKFGNHFIYLGIAYGLKFNVLLLLPLIFIIPLIQSKEIVFSHYLKKASLAFLYLIIGIVIAIPCLLLTPVKPIFLKTYLHETIGGTEKMYDNANLGFFDWMSSGLGGSYLGLGFLSFPFIFLIIYALWQSFIKWKKDKELLPLFFLISGLFLTLVIMLKTKRLWPHYLWTGYLFMLLGLIISINTDFNVLKHKLYMTIVCLFIGTSFYFFISRELPLYLNLSNRQEAKISSQNGLKAIAYINKSFSGKRIGTDASIIYPFKDFVKVDIYNPFALEIPETVKTRYYWYSDYPEKIWEDGNQIVVFDKRYPPKMLKENTNVYQGRHDELYKLFLEKTETEFIKDSSFGSIVIYKKR